jgi:hypothetical protein
MYKLKFCKRRKIPKVFLLCGNPLLDRTWFNKSNLLFIWTAFVIFFAEHFRDFLGTYFQSQRNIMIYGQCDQRFFLEKMPNEVRKSPKNVAQPMFRQILYEYFFCEKVSRIYIYITYLRNSHLKTAQSKNHPNGEYSPNLVTLSARSLTIWVLIAQIHLSN